MNRTSGPLLCFPYPWVLGLNSILLVSLKETRSDVIKQLMYEQFIYFYITEWILTMFSYLIKVEDIQ